MKYLKTLGKTVSHEFFYGTKIIWQEHFNECAIALFLIIIHLILSLFCSSQEEARKAIFISFLFLLTLLNVIVYLTKKRKLMFIVWYILWAGSAFYLRYQPITL